MAGPLSPSLELALHRALLGEVPDFVNAITAEVSGSGVVLSVYHLPTIQNGWRQEFEEVVESEFEQQMTKQQRPKLSFLFRGADEFEAVGPICVLHRRH